MTKAEIRKARKAAHLAGNPLEGDLALPGQPKLVIAVKAPRKTRERYASREEQNTRYIDCGPSNWDDR
jgi:hypothetical protein